MIVVEPFEGERINVSDKERDEINLIVDQSADRWSGPDFIVTLFKVARKNRKAKVYLRSEGWHQLKKINGFDHLHVSLHFAGWTYHLYTKYTKGVPITSEDNMIETISYEHYKKFYFIDPN